MNLRNFLYYLLIINMVGMVLYLLNKWLHSHTDKIKVDVIVAVVSLAGGSAGILLAILLFDRKAVKENMMSRVFTICVLVIQVIILLLVRNHKNSLTFAFWEFFGRHRIFSAYLIVINIITFAVYAIDKINAIGHRRRIRIVTLLGLAFIGGSIGGISAVYLLRHKTQKDYFTVGIPLIMLMQATVIFYLMNAG